VTDEGVPSVSVTLSAAELQLLRYRLSDSQVPGTGGMAVDSELDAKLHRAQVQLKDYQRKRDARKAKGGG
jgi:hypothetical protein